MQVRIRHDVTFHFGVPHRNLNVLLRLSPRSHEGQHVTGARVDADIDCSLRAGEDAFGNITHAFSAVGPIEVVTVTAHFEVETFDAAGLVRGAAERLPQDIFLRETELTATDAELRAFAERVTASEPETLGKLHALMQSVHAEVAWNEEPPPPGPPPAPMPAVVAFAGKTADAAGHAHVFCAAARHLGIPCRYISGYLPRDEAQRAVTHGWAEAFVPAFGWIGFDSALSICPNGDHIRVAAALDALGAALFRGPLHEEVRSVTSVVRL